MTEEAPPAEDPEEAPARKLDAKKELVRDLISFVGTVVAVVFFGWEAKDVIWGLWICSLTFGYTFIVISIFAPVFRMKGGGAVATALGGLFMLGFFTVHFGMFHVVHGQFLNQFFPLTGDRNGFMSPAIMIGTCLSYYWPMVLATYLSRYSDLPLHEGGPMMKGPQAMMKPYANVIRMHLLIFVFAGLHAANLSNLAVYPVLLFYFFPWSAFFGKKGAKV